MLCSVLSVLSWEKERNLYGNIRNKGSVTDLLKGIQKSNSCDQTYRYSDWLGIPASLWLVTLTVPKEEAERNDAAVSKWDRFHFNKYEPILEYLGKWD